MNLFRKLLLHTPVFTILLALLQVAAATFGSIGFDALSSIRVQLRLVDSKYTIITVLSADWYTGILFQEDELFTLTRQTGQSYPGL